jgi:hypothetical protein
MLAEMRRSDSPEPSDQAVVSRYAEWQRRIGTTDVTGLLEQAGMSDAGLRAWLRDDLKLQLYLDQRFNGRQAEVAGWVASLRQRAGIR